MSTTNTPNVNALFIILLIFMGLLFVSQSQDAEIAYKRAAIVGLYVIYLLIAGGVLKGCMVFYNAFVSKKLPEFSIIIEEQKVQIAVSMLALGTLMIQCGRQAVLTDDFPFFLTAFFVWQFMQTLVEKEQEPTITYGTGMACSYFEGYLQIIIPSDGKSDNLVDKMRKFEDSQGVIFPVKKLLVVVTYKTLFCPPDMKHYNQPDRYDLPQIEFCRHIEEVEKHVAGVVGRKYQNTAYRIWWQDNSRLPVYLVTEFATPLRTLYGVTHNPILYPELRNVNAQKLANDFCEQLKKIIDRSPECRGRCELVYFDDSPESTEYLPEVLLKKIEELEPNYQEIIQRHVTLMMEDEAFDTELVFPEPRVLVPNITLDE